MLSWLRSLFDKDFRTREHGQLTVGTVTGFDYWSEGGGTWGTSGTLAWAVEFTYDVDGSTISGSAKIGGGGRGAEARNRLTVGDKIAVYYRRDLIKGEWTLLICAVEREPWPLSEEEVQQVTGAES